MGVPRTKPLVSSRNRCTTRGFVASGANRSCRAVSPGPGLYHPVPPRFVPICAQIVPTRARRLGILDEQHAGRRDPVTFRRKLVTALATDAARPNPRRRSVPSDRPRIGRRVRHHGQGRARRPPARPPTGPPVRAPASHRTSRATSRSRSRLPAPVVRLPARPPVRGPGAARCDRVTAAEPALRTRRHALAILPITGDRRLHRDARQVPGGEPANVCAPDLPFRGDAGRGDYVLPGGGSGTSLAVVFAGPRRRAGGRTGVGRVPGRETCQCVRAGSAVPRARRRRGKRGFRDGHAARVGGVAAPPTKSWCSRRLGRWQRPAERSPSASSSPVRWHAP